jgi:tetratricopeptide (TPR) repeat protein
MKQSATRRRVPRPDPEWLLKDLDSRNVEGRDTLVRNSSCYGHPAFIEGVLQRARSVRARDIASAVQFSRLATLAATHLSASCASADLAVSAWSEYGNCLRIAGELQASEKAFMEARRLLPLGSGRPGLRASLLEKHASLLVKLNRFSEGVAELREALSIRQTEPDPDALGAALVQYAVAVGETGESLEAVRLLGRAARLVDRHRTPRLALAVGHNMAEFLLELGRPSDAQAALATVNPLYVEVDEPLLLLKRTWMRGKIASSLLQDETATTHLGSAIAGYLERAFPYEAAVAGLDLALHHAESSRLSEARRTAAAVLPILDCLEVEGKAAAARLLARVVAGAEQVAALVSQASQFLSRSSRARTA